MSSNTKPPEKNLADIGERLKFERNRLGLKAITVYESLDIYQTTYKNYEEGKRDIPSSLLINLWHLGFDIVFILLGNQSSATQNTAKSSSNLPKKLTEAEMRQLKMLAEAQNKLKNTEHKLLVSQQIDGLLKQDLNKNRFKRFIS